MKRFLALACAASLAIASLGVTAMAANSPTSDLPVITSTSYEGEEEIIVRPASEANWEEDLPEDVLTLLTDIADDPSANFATSVEEMFSDVTAVEASDGSIVDLSDYIPLMEPFEVYYTGGSLTTDTVVTWVTSAITGLSESNDVLLIVYDETAGVFRLLRPDEIDYTTGEMTTTFGSLSSPVIIIYKQTSAEPTSAALPYGCIAVAVILAAGALVGIAVSKRR